MTFLHKLARRLARMKTAMLMGVLLTSACEQVLATAGGTVPEVPAVASVASVSVTPGAVSATTGQSVQLTATPRDANGNALSGRTVSWSSSNTAVVTVNGNGVATGVPAGSATITATSEGKSGTAAITVTQTPAAVASVTVTPASAGVTVGLTVQLTATVKDASGNVLVGRVVTWGSSNTAAATMIGSGLVSGVAAGSAMITATSEGKSGTAAITVTQTPVASVTVTPAPTSVIVGLTVQLTATVKDASGNVLVGRAVTWGSSNTAAATTIGSGLVSGVAAGSAMITATSEGKSGTAAITVTQTPAAVASVTVTPASASVTVGLTVQLTATVKDASGNVLVGRSITWGSSNTGVAIVNGNGLVTALAVGAATITASSDGKSAAAAVTVTLPSTSAQWPNEPAGFTVRNDDGWSDVIPAGIGTDQYLGNGWGIVQGTASLGHRISDATAPLSPPYALEIVYPTGFGGGSAPATLWYDIPGPNAPEIYIGFWLKVSNPWQGHGSGVNKIVFVTSGVTNDAAAMPVLYGSAAPYYLRSQVEESGTANAHQGWLTQNVANPEFTLGVWHRIEIYLKYGTTSTSYNGIQKMWLDGALVINYSDINYAEDGINGWKFSPTWGGAGGVKTQNDYYRIDHVHTSTR